MHGFDLDQDDGTGFMDGHKKGFADLKRVTCIKDRAGFRLDRDGAREGLRSDRATVDMKYKVEVAQDFKRVDPGFERSSLVAEHPGLRADGRKKFPGAHRSRKGQTGILCKCGDRKNSQQQRALAAGGIVRVGCRERC